MQLDAATFVDAARRVLHVAHAAKAAPHGVLFEQCDGVLRFAATDRVRLAVALVASHGEDGGDPLRAAVATHSLERALDAVGALDRVVEIRQATNGELELRTSAATHTIAIIPDDFPDVEKLLDADANSRTATVDRRAFVDAIEEATTDDALGVRMTVGAIEFDGGTRVLADYTGGDVSFAVNPEFLHDAAATANGDRIAVDAAGEVRPIVVRSLDPANYLCVVMPVRVRGKK